MILKIIFVIRIVFFSVGRRIWWCVSVRILESRSKLVMVVRLVEIVECNVYVIFLFVKFSLIRFYWCKLSKVMVKIVYFKELVWVCLFCVVVVMIMVLVMLILVVFVGVVILIKMLLRMVIISFSVGVMLWISFQVFGVFGFFFLGFLFVGVGVDWS